MSAAQLARRAAQVMSERGHCKGKIEDDEGRVCLVGALTIAAQEEDYTPVIEATNLILAERGVKAAVSLFSSFPFYLSVFYNNDPGTTGEDVILLLKEAGHRLEEEENGR